MSPKQISMMVQCNRNHKIPFHRIRSKIKAAYFVKHDPKNFIHTETCLPALSRNEDTAECRWGELCVGA
jgi:hypothetical protein